MGLFSSFVRKLNEVRQDAKEIVNDMKEFASEIADNIDKGKIKDAVLETVAGVIVAPFYIADKLGVINLDGYNKATAKVIGETYALTENSSPEQVDNIVSLLRERVEVYQENGKKMETAAKEDINKFFKELTEDFNENAEVAKQINFEQIEDNHKKLLQDIEGAYSAVYEKKLSIDDAECRSILAMDRGKAKETAMLKFTEGLKKKAIENFAETFGNVISQQENDICKALDNYFNAKANDFAEQTKTFQDWERDMKNQTFNQEKAQLPATVKLYTIDRLEKILAA